MILKRIEISNIKSYYPNQIIDFNNKVNIFIGPNGGGKSNLFEIVQGVISNILFKHVQLNPNPERNNREHTNFGKPYILVDQNPDQINLNSNILDPHALHETEPSSLYLTMQFTRSDIATLNYILTNKENIKRTLEDKVANSAWITYILDQFTENSDLNYFINKNVKLFLLPRENINLQIADYTGIPISKHSLLNGILELLKIVNVLNEISLLFPTYQLSPFSRYIGPHRSIAQPPIRNVINLSTLGSIDDNFSKDINLSKDTATSNLDQSFTKLALLKHMNRDSIIEKYKDYLLRYLKIDMNVQKLEELELVYEYEITFSRDGLSTLKLSSGEKEFFNLITGLILSGLKNGIVMLDEPELHLHSQWQQVIINLILELSSDFNIQFLIITHSPKFVTAATLKQLLRVAMSNKNSYVVQPDNPTANNETKDLIQFLNSTNNEKIFFTNKVILVEGLSDQIIIDSIVSMLKQSTKSETEIEVLQTGSKNNLNKFRNLLNEWKIENYVIADLDYFKELRSTSNNIITSQSIIQSIIDNASEISQIIQFSERKLKDVLCRRSNLDNKSLIDLILDKPNLQNDEFLTKIDALTDYIISERATTLTSTLNLSTNIMDILNNLSNLEGIFLLDKGEIENYYSYSSNKIENAIMASSKMKTRGMDDRLRKFIKKIILN